MGVGVRGPDAGLLRFGFPPGDLVQLADRRLRLLDVDRYPRRVGIASLATAFASAVDRAGWADLARTEPLVSPALVVVLFPRIHVTTHIRCRDATSAAKQPFGPFAGRSRGPAVAAVTTVARCTHAAAITASLSAAAATALRTGTQGVDGRLW